MNEEGTVMIILNFSETNANNLRQLYILKKKKKRVLEQILPLKGSVIETLPAYLRVTKYWQLYMYEKYMPS